LNFGQPPEEAKNNEEVVGVDLMAEIALAG